MTHTQFFEKHGHELKCMFADDNGEFGQFLVLYPEEKDIAYEHLNNGHNVYTVYEESAPEGHEEVMLGLEDGSPYIVGYYILNK